MLNNPCLVHIFKVKEVFSFCQDDLATEETLILDCNEEIYVWVGLHSDITSKEQALNIGKVISDSELWFFISSGTMPCGTLSSLFNSTLLQMFLQDGVLHGGRSIETTMYAITEGDEPVFFRNFFNWDNSKQSSVSSDFWAHKWCIIHHKVHLSSSLMHA